MIRKNGFVSDVRCCGNASLHGPARMSARGSAIRVIVEVRVMTGSEYLREKTRKGCGRRLYNRRFRMSPVSAYLYPYAYQDAVSEK